MANFLAPTAELMADFGAASSLKIETKGQEKKMENRISNTLLEKMKSKTLKVNAVTELGICNRRGIGEDKSTNNQGPCPKKKGIEKHNKKKYLITCLGLFSPDLLFL